MFSRLELNVLLTMNRPLFIESEKFDPNRENIEIYYINLDIFSIGIELFAFNELGYGFSEGHFNLERAVCRNQDGVASSDPRR